MSLCIIQNKTILNRVKKPSGPIKCILNDVSIDLLLKSERIFVTPGTRSRNERLHWIRAQEMFQEDDQEMEDVSTGDPWGIKRYDT